MTGQNSCNSVVFEKITGDKYNYNGNSVRVHTFHQRHMCYHNRGSGNWKVNILALVSYESDENWDCVMTKIRFWPFRDPWTLTWSLPKSNRLVLGWWQIIPENFMQFGPVVFFTFLWPWPWPLTWSLPKSNRLVLGWWQIIPENFMQFGPVVFEKSW